MEPANQRGRPAKRDDGIEEIDLDDMPQAQMSGSVWDRVLVALFTVALLGGVVIAVTNLFREAPVQTAQASPPPTTRPFASPASTAGGLSVGKRHTFSGLSDPHPFTFTVPTAGWHPIQRDRIFKGEGPGEWPVI